MNGSTLLSTLCIAALLLTGCGTSEFSEPAPKASLPAEFSSYQYIDDISAFGGGHTLEKFKYSAPGQMQYSINKNQDTLIIKTTSPIYDHTKRFSFYKLNSSGDIVDEHQFIQSSLVEQHSGTEELVGGSFLVNKENTYYTTWPIDGDKTKKQLIPVNKNLAWSDAQVDAYYAAIVEKAARVDSFIEYEAINSHENKARTRVVYYLNTTGKWYVLYGNSLRGGYTGKGLRAGENIIFKDFDISTRMDDAYIPPPNITIPYFEKLMYRKTVSAGGGSTNSASSVSYHWDGIGYFQVAVGGSVLKFKNNATLSHTDFGTQQFPAKESLLSALAYYTNPRLKFALLLVNGSLYIIR